MKTRTYLQVYAVPVAVVAIGTSMLVASLWGTDQLFSFELLAAAGTPQTSGVAIYRNCTVYTEYAADGLANRVPPLDFAVWVPGKRPQFVPAPATAALYEQLQTANAGLPANVVTFEACWGRFESLSGACLPNSPRQYPALACNTQLHRMASACVIDLPPYVTTCEVRVQWTAPIAGLEQLPPSLLALLVWAN